MKGNHKATAFQVSEGLKAFQVPKKRRAFQGTGGRRGTRTPPSSFFGHVFMAFCLVGLLGGGRGTAMNDNSRVIRHRSLNLAGHAPSDAEIDSLSLRPKHSTDHLVDRFGRHAMRFGCRMDSIGK